MENIFSYLLSLIGLTLLCAIWVKFQLWLRKRSNNTQHFSPGCGACQNKSLCADGAVPHSPTKETKIKSTF